MTDAVAWSPSHREEVIGVLWAILAVTAESWPIVWFAVFMAAVSLAAAAYYAVRDHLLKQEQNR